MRAPHTFSRAGTAVYGVREQGLVDQHCIREKKREQSFNLVIDGQSRVIYRITGGNYPPSVNNPNNPVFQYVCRETIKLFYIILFIALNVNF